MSHSSRGHILMVGKAQSRSRRQLVMVWSGRSERRMLWLSSSSDSSEVQVPSLLDGAALLEWVFIPPLIPVRNFLLDMPRV